MSAAPRFPASRLALGTVQLGLRYGVANTQGVPDDAQAARILALARQAGVATLDPAVGYGDSEARLGALGVEGFAVMSKLPAAPEGVDIARWVEQQVDGSLQRLRIARLDALSLHRPAQALGARGPALLAALREQRERGRVGALGVSIYSPEELAPLFAAFDFELVQAPANVFDRRIVDSGWAARLRERGCALHLRSCFLQGLLLLPAAQRPAWSVRWQGMFARWDRFLRESGLGALEACLRFALGLPGERLVLGVDSAAQLEAILAVEGTPLALPSDLSCHDPDLLDPSRWPPTQK